MARKARGHLPTIIPLILTLSGCSSTQSTVDPPEEGASGTPADGVGAAAGAAGAPTFADAKTLSCAPWAQFQPPGWKGVLVNNVWNEQWAAGQPHEQCLLEAKAPDAGYRYGWRWAWPQYRPYTSYAAPEILFGRSPWSGGVSTVPGLPTTIESLQALQADFAVNVQADPMYNLNLTMWLTSTANNSAEKNPSDIRAEIMVWFANPAKLGGGLPHDGDVTLDGVTFGVYHKENNGDASGVNPNTWTMIIYMNRADQYEANFDLKLVLDDAVQRGLVEPDHAVGSVELISEIFGGSGELWVNRFQVEVN